MQLKSFLKILAAALFLLTSTNAHPTTHLDKRVCVICLAMYNTCKETSTINTFGVCVVDYNECLAIMKGHGNC